MEHYKEISDINRLVIHLPFLKEELEFAKLRGYNNILIDGSKPCIDTFGFPCKHVLNINLICGYDFIETLVISGNSYSIEPCNLNSLSIMPQLKSLGLWAEKVFSIDFSVFPKLTEVEFYYTKQIENVNTLTNLRRLHIYNLKSEELEELKNMALLEELILWDANNINLNGLFLLTNMRKLDIIRSKKMTDISSLCHSNKLEELNLSYCNNITEISVLSHIPQLKKIRFVKCKQLQDLTQLVPNNTIESIYISVLNDLSFIAGMKHLKSLCFDDVIDGDISPLFGSISLESVSMISKKKYSHTEKEVNQILEKNRLNI